MNTPDRQHSLLHPSILLPFALITLIWGSTWLVIRDQVAAGGIQVPASWSVCYRFALAALGMFAFAAVRRLPLKLDRQGLMFAAALGLFQFTMNFNFVYRAELYLTSGVVAVLYALLLVPNSLLARIFFREAVTPGFLAGSAIALCGIAMLFTHEYRDATVDQRHVLAGVALGLAGLLSASVSNVMQGSAVARARPMPVLVAWAMLLGALFDALLAWTTSGPPVFDPRLAYIAGIAYLALAGSVVTFPLYFVLIQRIGAGRAAYSGVAVPVIAMALSTVFEGYHWSVLAGSGAMLAMLGMVVALRAKRKPS